MTLDAAIKIALFVVGLALSLGGYVVRDQLARIDGTSSRIESRVSGLDGRVGLLENHSVGTGRDIGAQNNAIADLKHAVEKLDERQRASERALRAP